MPLEEANTSINAFFQSKWKKTSDTEQRKQNYKFQTQNNQSEKNTCSPKKEARESAKHVL